MTEKRKCSELSSSSVVQELYSLYIYNMSVSNSSNEDISLVSDIAFGLRRESGSTKYHKLLQVSATIEICKIK